MLFIAHDQVPRDRLKDVLCELIVVDYIPQKEEPHRTRLTVGVNLIVYAGDVITPTSDITTVNLIINSTIYTPGARYMFFDIKLLLGNTINLILIHQNSYWYPTRIYHQVI